MDPIPLVLCIGLHALATIILVGLYLPAALIVVPVLHRLTSEQDQARLIPALVVRSRPWVLGSLFVFILSGTLLMITDTSYLGFLNFGNAWSILMIVKHVLIFPWIFMCVALDRNIARRLAEARNGDRPGLIARFTKSRSRAAS